MKKRHSAGKANTSASDELCLQSRRLTSSQSRSNFLQRGCVEDTIFNMRLLQGKNQCANYRLPKGKMSWCEQNFGGFAGCFKRKVDCFWFVWQDVLRSHTTSQAATPKAWPMIAPVKERHYLMLVFWVCCLGLKVDLGFLHNKLKACSVSTWQTCWMTDLRVLQLCCILPTSQSWQAVELLTW